MTGYMAVRQGDVHGAGEGHPTLEKGSARRNVNATAGVPSMIGSIIKGCHNPESSLSFDSIPNLMLAESAVGEDRRNAGGRRRQR
jgi:hypothetical protein